MRDRLVLYPAVIGGFVNAWLLQLLMANAKDIPLVLALAAAVWCTGLLIQLIVAQIGIETAHGKMADFGKVLWLSVKRFFPALSVVSALLCGMLFIYWLGTLHSFIRLAVIAPLFFVAIVVQLYPVVYSISGRSALTAMLVLYAFVRERFQLFVQLLLFMVLLSLSFLLFSTLIVELPAGVKSLLVPVLQGCYVVSINYAIVVAWLVQSKVQGVA